MKKHLVRISPFHAGIVIALVFGLIGFPIMIAALVSVAGRPPGVRFPVGIPFLPVVYAAVGFVGGIVLSFVYNGVAKWTGGLQFEVRDTLPPAS